MYKSISACYERFLIKMNETDRYVELLNEQRSFLSEMSGKNEVRYIELLREVSNSAIIYNAIIVGIYSSFEYFIDSLFDAYLSFRIQNNNRLSDAEKKDYYFSACEYITNPNRYRNYPYSINDVIRSMFQMECEAVDRPLNQLMLRHGGNLNYDQTKTLAIRIGLKSFDSSFSAHAKEKDYLKAILNDDLREELGRNADHIKQKWQDIVDQRNAIAHSGFVDNRYSPNILKDYIAVFGVIGYIIYHIVLETMASFLISKGNMGKFEPIYNVFRNRILCTNLGNMPLKIKDIIVSYNSEGKCKILTIENIRINDVDVCEVSELGTAIGIQVDKAIKANQTFYYFLSSDSSSVKGQNTAL